MSNYETRDTNLRESIWYEISTSKKKRVRFFMKFASFVVMASIVFQQTAMAVSSRVMIQPIQPQHIAVSGGNVQSISIAGPSEFEEARAMVVKSNETSQGILVVIGKTQQGHYLIDGTNQLMLNMTDATNGHRLTSIVSNKDKSFTLRYRSPEGAVLSFNTDIEIKYQNDEYIVTGFSHDERDQRTGVYDTCQLSLTDGKLIHNEKKSYIGKVKIKMSELSDKDLRFYGCGSWKK